MLKLVSSSLFLIIILSACSQNESKRIEEFSYDNLYGTWRIDSTAENGSFNKRTTIKDEFFVFLKDRTVKMKTFENGTEKAYTLGTYKVVSDTLRITTPKGSEGMNFKIRLDGNLIELNGTFPISDYNQRKPTMFLGRK